MSEPPPDHLFELTENSVAVVSPRQPARQRHEVLVERAAAASPNAVNLLKPQLYRDALSRIAPLEQPGKRNGAALIIPDYAVRMSVIELEQFPSSEPERLSLLRFRLRKTVPFHIEEAQLSYSVQINQPKQVEVLTVSIARPILDEYETLFSAAGYKVGLVMPSSIAVLPVCSTQTPGHSERGITIVAKAAGSTLTVLLLDGARVRLVRCVDLTDENEAPQPPRDEHLIIPILQQTLAYAEDQLKQPVQRLLLCGFGTDTDALGTLAQQEFKIGYAPLRSKFGVASQANAGLLGLLEQYAA